MGNAVKMAMLDSINEELEDKKKQTDLSRGIDNPM